MSRSQELANHLDAGASLIHTEDVSKPTDLRSILSTRLSQYRSQIGAPARDYTTSSLDEVQQETALEALGVIECVQQILDEDAGLNPPLRPPTDEETASRRLQEDTPGEVPNIGTRDLMQLRTLLSIVFKWGTEPLLARILPAWPAKQTSSVYRGPKLIDLTNTPEDYALLTSLTKRLFVLVFPRGVQGTIPQTLITNTILTRYVTEVLRPGITLGWVPKNLSSETMPVIDELRPLAMRLLSILPASQTMASLGAILSNPSAIAPHVQKACGSLLSRQLLRPDGVLGLVVAIFGEGEQVQDDAPLEKLEHVARILSAVPATIKPEEYYSTVVPRILDIISSEENVPPAYRRAAAFSLARMLDATADPARRATVAHTALPLLHTPLLSLTPTEPPPALTPSLTPTAVLHTLQTFLTNTDPSPTLLSQLLSPVLPALYAVSEALARTKTADPTMREAARGLLMTWGRIVGAEEGAAVLWACVEGQGGEWAVDVAGELTRGEGGTRGSSLALFTPEDLKKAEEGGELDMDANILDLRPDPAQFVRYLKALDRTDIASEIFVRLLEAYRDLKAERDGDPMKTLLYLQLIVQMQAQMSAEGAAGNILSKPEHILSFVKHALEDSITTAAPEECRETAPKQGLTMDDLRIVEEDEEEVMEGDADSDDENPDAEGVPPDEEMTPTALNLLLSVLEANPDLSVQTTPILTDISKLIEQLTKHPSDTLRPLAREALMVLTVRSASTSTSPGPARPTSKNTVQETYQKALKLLQDPILPVRAHGLLLLRQLVAAPAHTDAVRPLVPAVLDIFLQAAQDDDSYVFLQAVQGLAALADSAGAEVLRALVRVYAAGLDGAGAVTARDVDLRVRVGEALAQVIKRCGEALPKFADILVPPLFNMVRQSHLPTTLRTSALSLLAQCAETSDIALLPYAADLSGAMLDLLQIESVRETPAAPKAAPGSTSALDNPQVASAPKDAPDRPEPKRKPSPPPPPTMDSHPAAADSKFPPLRRAALHFLGLLVRAYTTRVHTGESMASMREFPAGRAKTILGYVAATDVDAVVRVMAGEVREAVVEMEQAAAGL